jgi:hypothetical protein
MKEFMFTARDVHWVYNEETGSIPFIINEKKNKVKQLEDGFVIDILDKDQCSNPLTAAKNTFESYYGKPMSYVGFTAMFARVNTFQNLKWFYYQKLDGNTFLNSEQIELLSKNYDKKVAKETQKQLREDTKKQAEKEERQRVFDF